MPKAAMTEDNALALAEDCLAFLASQPGTFGRFAELAGLDPATVRQRVSEREFLVSLLDFILADEGLLVEFCENSSEAARDLHVARHMLEGK